MAKNGLDKSAAARAVEKIRLQREEDRRRWNAQAERMAARGRAVDAAEAQLQALAWEKKRAEHKPRVHAIHGGVERREEVAARLPTVENRHTRERGHSITYEFKTVLCGKKGCNKPHGPYWYAYWTAGGRVRSVYIGKTFKSVEEKCPERLKTA